MQNRITGNRHGGAHLKCLHREAQGSAGSRSTTATYLARPSLNNKKQTMVATFNTIMPMWHLCIVSHSCISLFHKKTRADKLISNFKLIHSQWTPLKLDKNYRLGPQKDNIYKHIFKTYPQFQ